MSTSNRSRRLSALVTLAVIATALAFVTLAAAAGLSADVAGNMNGKPISGKLYMKGSSIREEMSMGSEKMVIIALPDKKVAWLIDPAKKTYMEARGEHVANITARTGLTIP